MAVNVTGADLVILVPMLGRWDRLPRLLHSAFAATPEAQVWLLVSEDDASGRAHLDPARINDGRVVASLVDSRAGTSGDYARKINHGAAHSDRDWIFTGAIDLCFCSDWYAQAARVQHATGALVVGTNDLCNPRTAGTYRGSAHSTHSLFARSYVNERGTADVLGRIYHEGYVHEFVDDEAVRTARYRGVYAHAEHSRVEHLHPACGKEATDPVYRQQGRRIGLGRAEFDRRKHLWGGDG